jgi:hypothetical protein
MSARLSMITTVAALALGTIAVTGTAQAAVVGPSGAMQGSAQSFGLVQQARRICQPVLRCGKFPTGCHWHRQCSVTADYPPEHNRRR